MKIFFTLFITTAILSGCTETSGVRGQVGPLQNKSGIVGGHEVAAGQFGSEFAVLIYKETESGESSVCTGTFISEFAILTAAHCVNDEVTGMNVIFSPTPFTSVDAPTLTLTKTITHPQYRKGHNDLALILFSGGLPAGAKAVTMTKAPWAILDYKQIFAVGYGRTEGAQDASDASPELGTLRGVNIPTQNTTAKMNGFYTNQKDEGVCFGDSGGPAIIVDKNDQPIVIGVANSVISSPENSDVCKYKSVYLDIGFYTDWLQSTLQTEASAFSK